jgi:hypothetical protein
MKTTIEGIKKWMEDNNYENSGLRTNHNHRIDLYLSDMLFDFAKHFDKPDEQSIALAAGHQCGTPFSERWIGFIKGAKWALNFKSQEHE